MLLVLARAAYAYAPAPAPAPACAALHLPALGLLSRVVCASFPPAHLRLVTILLASFFFLSLSQYFMPSEHRVPALARASADTSFQFILPSIYHYSIFRHCRDVTSHPGLTATRPCDPSPSRPPFAIICLRQQPKALHFPFQQLIPTARLSLLLSPCPSAISYLLVSAVEAYSAAESALSIICPFRYHVAFRRVISSHWRIRSFCDNAVALSVRRLICPLAGFYDCSAVPAPVI